MPATTSAHMNVTMRPSANARRLRFVSAVTPWWCSAVVTAGLATPALDPFASGHGADHERGDGVGPPPPGDRIREQAYEQGDREVGAEHVLAALSDRRRRTERVPNAALRPGEQRHRRGRERGEPNPDPARFRLLPADEVANRLDRHVRGKQEVADRDGLLRVPLGGRRAESR